MKNNTTKDHNTRTELYNHTVQKLIRLLTLICIKWVPGDPSTIFLATIFTQKKPESSGSMYSSILMLENI